MEKQNSQRVCINFFRKQEVNLVEGDPNLQEKGGYPCT